MLEDRNDENEQGTGGQPENQEERPREERSGAKGSQQSDGGPAYDSRQPYNQQQGGYQNPYGYQNYQGGQGYQPYGQQPYHQQNRQEEYQWNFSDYETAGRKSHPKRSKGIAVFGVLLGVVVVAGIIFLSGFGIYNLVAQPGVEIVDGHESQSAGRNTPALAIKDHPAEPSSGVSADGKMSTREIAKTVRPSVVGILQYSSANTFTPSGEGSGIIMNSGGYILTNAHVVENATGINVVLDNGENYSARLIGIDKKTDLAVIKIEAQNLVAATFGNSDQLEVGDTVIAIGNPGGVTLAGSVTQGIVSAIRSLQTNEGGYSSDYIQTDAAINPGNSGGALVNEYGQVIGINSSKIADIDYEGIGFAIPINEAKPIIDDLMEYGYVKGRVKLGISGQAVNEAVSQINGIPTGIYVWSIEPTSDLAGKNVAKGDVIVKIDGHPVSSFDEVSQILEGKKPGDTVILTVFRQSRMGNGNTFEVRCTLQEDIDSYAAGKN